MIPFYDDQFHGIGLRMKANEPVLYVKYEMDKQVESYNVDNLVQQVTNLKQENAKLINLLDKKDGSKPEHETAKMINLVNETQ